LQQICSNLRVEARFLRWKKIIHKKLVIGYILNNEILEAFPLMPRMRQGTNILQHLKVVANAMSENNKKEKTTVTNI
jgi:hypothetical protein